MGTYLHPFTQDSAKLELLARVPAGTHAKLMDYKARKPIILYTVAMTTVESYDGPVAKPIFRVHMPSGAQVDCNTAEWSMGDKYQDHRGYWKRDWGYALHEDMQRVPHLQQLDDFLLFGFGNVRVNLANIGLDYACGSTEDPWEIRKIMDAQLKHDVRSYIGSQTKFFGDDISLDDLGGGLSWS